MCGIIYCMSLVLKSHTHYKTFRNSHHTPPFSSRVICTLLASTSLPHTDMLRRAADRHSHHLQVKLSERNSLWLFPFFSWVFCEAVVMVMGHKDSSGSRCTHEWEEHWVCECECGCVFVCPAWCLRMRFRDDLPLISWLWCVFYCLLNRGFCLLCFAEGLNKVLIFSPSRDPWHTDSWSD